MRHTMTILTAGAMFLSTAAAYAQPGSVRSHQEISDTEGNFTGRLDDLDYFASTIASPGDLDSDDVVDLEVGAPLDDDGSQEHGAVWVLFLDGAPACFADCNEDNIVNTLDFLRYLNLFGASEPAADCNGDGIVNTLDFLCFLNAYNEGC